MGAKNAVIKRMSAYALTVMFIACAFVAIRIPAAGGAPPVGPGDWVVSTTEVYDGGTWPGGVIDLQGNLTIRNGGNLTLQNGLQLRFTCSFDNEFHIEVQRGGVLQILDMARVTRVGPHNYAFHVRDGATLNVKSLGVIEFAGTQNAMAEDSGIYINTDKALFMDAIIRNNVGGIVVDSKSPVIRDSEIYQNTMAGIIVTGEGAEPRIFGNDIHDNPSMGGYGAGIMVTEDADPNITDNNIQDNMWGVMTYTAKARITNNTFFSNNQNNEGIGVFAVNEGNVTVINNTFDQNTVGVGMSNLATGVIKGNFFRNHMMGAGISIGDHSEAEVAENSFNQNAAGIWVGYGSSPKVHDNTMMDNIRGMFLEGDHTEVYDNTIGSLDAIVNTFEGIHLESHSEAYIHDNTVADIEGGSGMRVEEYSTAVIEGNDITGCAVYGIEVGDFAAPDLLGNTMTDNSGGVMFGYHARGTLRGGTIQANNMEGINTGWYSTPVIEDVTVDNSASASSNVVALWAEGGTPVIMNSSLTGKDVDVVIGPQAMATLLNVTFDHHLVDFHYPVPAGGDLSRGLAVGWFLDVGVEWQNGAPVRDAQVDIEDADGAVVSQRTTSEDGKVAPAAIVQYVRTHMSVWHNYTDHTVNVTKNGVHQAATVTMDTNRAVTVTMTDIADPFVDIAAPADGDHISNHTIVANGTAADPESGVVSVEVTVDDGANWTLTDTTDGWANWDTSLDLEDGTYDLRVVATNAAGGTNEAALTFHVDTVVDLDVQHPPNGHLTNQTDLTITGTAEDGLHLRINGANVSVINGTFARTITLTEGQNIIDFNTTDLAGNVLNFTRVVELDTVEPAIEILSPGMYSTTPDVVLEGGVSEPAHVTINGANVTYDAANLTFERSYINLTDGEYDFTIVATDAAGNTNTTVVRVTVDTVAPALAVVSPIDGTFTNDPNITVNGTTDGDRMTIDGVNVTIVNGTFSADIVLDPMENEVVVKVLDLAGNSAEAVIGVTFDDEAPLLTIFTPISGHVSRETPVQVWGITEPGVNVTANGIEMPVDWAGKFLGYVPAVDGTNTVTIIATDQAGNSVTEARTVIYDGTPPQVTITGLKNGTTVSEPTIKVKGVLSEPDAVLTINGKVVEVGPDGNFSLKMDLFEGENTIVVQAVDKGGNYYLEKFEITRERAVDLGWAAIGVLFTMLGVVIGIAGGYAWGKWKATKERPRRRPLGTLEDQVKARKEAEKKGKGPAVKEKAEEEPEEMEEMEEMEEVAMEEAPPPAPKPKEAPKAEAKPPKATRPSAAPPVQEKVEPKGPEPGPTPKPKEVGPAPAPQEEKKTPSAEPKDEGKGKGTAAAKGPDEAKPEEGKEASKEEKPKTPSKEEKIDDDLQDILSRLKV